MAIFIKNRLLPTKIFYHKLIYDRKRTCRLTILVTLDFGNGKNVATVCGLAGVEKVEAGVLQEFVKTLRCILPCSPESNGVAFFKSDCMRTRAKIKSYFYGYFEPGTCISLSIKGIETNFDFIE